MSEADAEDGAPLDLDNHIAKEMTETILCIMYFGFKPAPKIRRAFLPHPPARRKTNLAKKK
jgi:hypothetical protein